MKKLVPIIILMCFSISFSQTTKPTPDKSKNTKPTPVDSQMTRPVSDASKQSEPRLYYKSNNREVTEKRTPKVNLKLINPNDKTRSIDFSVENIGKTEGLVVVSESLDEKYNNWKVVVKNKGILKSENSVYAVIITKTVTEKMTGQNPFPKSVSKVVYQDYKVLPKLNPNEEMTLWFNFDKSGMPSSEKSPFAGMFSSLSKTLASYKIETYFVTEPIVVK